MHYFQNSKLILRLLRYVIYRILTIKHEYLRSCAYIRLSLSSPLDTCSNIFIWPLSRYSCFDLGSLHPRNFDIKVCPNSKWGLHSNSKNSQVGNEGFLQKNYYLYVTIWAFLGQAKYWNLIYLLHRLLFLPFCSPWTWKITKHLSPSALL